MIEFISQPWPWYVAGPLIGIVVPALFLLGGKQFGISENLRHACAIIPSNIEFFQYNWKNGLWNLTLILGVVLGGWISVTWIGGSELVAISSATQADLTALGVSDFNGLVPSELFSWDNLLTGPGLILMIGGGFLIGFGSRYAGGCTSGHAISGLADLQLPSLIAVVGFFVGGLIATFFLLPLIL